MPGEGKKPLPGAVMRMLRCLEVGDGWCFGALHVAGVDNSIAGDISQCEPETFHDNLRAFRPNVAWRRQILAPAGVEMSSDVFAARQPVIVLRLRLKRLTRQFSGLGPIFGDW